MTSEPSRADQIFPDAATSQICPPHQEKSSPREIRLLGRNILDNSELREGDRLYLYVSLECKPLVAELKLADSFIPFLPTLKRESADK